METTKKNELTDAFLEDMVMLLKEYVDYNTARFQETKDLRYVNTLDRANTLLFDVMAEFNSRGE